MPLFPIPGNVFKSGILGQDKGRGFRSPSRYAGITVSAVTHHSEIIRNRLRLYAEFFHYARFIAHDLASAVLLNYASAHNRLGKVFVRRADEDLPHSFVLRGFGGGRG